VNVLAILGAVTATLLAAGILALIRAAWRWHSARVPAAVRDDFPVRLTCRSETDFHPSSGYHEGLSFEVFNHSDKAVRIKGFGLKLRLSGRNGEWFETEQTRSHPPLDLPSRLLPNDGLEGYLDSESLGDRLHEEGLTRNSSTALPTSRSSASGSRRGRLSPASPADRLATGPRFDEGRRRWTVAARTQSSRSSPTRASAAGR
jgi:hypothetical protein